jgi:hypothetical protein
LAIRGASAAPRRAALRAGMLSGRETEWYALASFIVVFLSTG